MEIHKNTLYYLFIVAVLPAFYKCTADIQPPKYSDLACDGDGHIKLTVTDSIQSVVSNCTSVSQNSVTSLPADKTVTVDNCPLNTHVKILMLERNVDSHLDAKLDPRRVGEAIDVMCNGKGLEVITSIINVPGVSFKPVPVSYQERLTMILLDGDGKVETITLGGSYTLQITAADNLHIHVQSCDAYPGNEKSETVHLFISGNPDGTNSVLTNFKEATLQTASATMTGFRFIGKDNVVITCTVDVSTPTTTTASPITTTITRRRRNAFQQKHKNTLEVSTSFRVESLSTNGVKGMVAKEGRCILVASILLVKYCLHWFWH
ncbi:uncharacterized protein LOC110457508 [Mizuhopecten yessoensis]|uniref:uncharacterized protein LOC110457508 n=1 Tax=Mizuhopecten yessoensis TaxID=6573 RepID=UPI000B45B166|nr:uncharacterized protein LOC110457508 [Mizuhopecten yessoensis]